MKSTKVARAIFLVVMGLEGALFAQTPQQEKTDPMLSSLDRVPPVQFRFEGNTAFSATRLAEITKPFAGRELTPEELEEARRQITLFYVRNGYISSGAILPDQPVREGGNVTFRLVEGRLEQIELKGNRHFKEDYLKSRLLRESGKPFNINQTSRALEILRQNPNVARVNADVQPGARPGETRLNVALEENRPYQVGLQFDNRRPISIGDQRLSLITSHSNLTGRDDALSFRAGLTQNNFSRGKGTLDDFSLSYFSPPNNSKSNFFASFSRNDSAVIEEPFRTLDIASRSHSASLGLRRVMNRQTDRELALTLAVENRRSLTLLGGQPFSFSRGDVNGESKTTALRFGQEFFKRDQKRVVAFRTLFSYAAGFPGSTKNALTPNGHFVAFLGQSQMVQRLGDSNRQIIFRAAGQMANNPLLTVEQFSVGGAGSVRGYRENQLVRDIGVTTSAEFRAPVITDKDKREVLTLAAFSDLGFAKNLGAGKIPGTNTLASVGVGALYNKGRMNAQVYVGFPLRNVPNSGNSLQSKGVHFTLNYGLF